MPAPWPVVDRLAEVTKLDPERVREEIREWLMELVGHPAVHVAVRYRVEFGNVPSAILRVATEIDSDFIILGMRRPEPSIASCGPLPMNSWGARLACADDSRQRAASVTKPAQFLMLVLRPRFA